MNNNGTNINHAC